MDSPLSENQVHLLPEVPSAVAKLTESGYCIAIITNQPAWAKGKTTKDNLERVHAKVLQEVQALGGRIASSHICYHRHEDDCGCRKPRTGLLEEAFRQNGFSTHENVWMVGDGVTDIQAGQAMGLRTAFVARRKSDVIRLLEEQGVQPTLWVDNLSDFVHTLINPKRMKEEVRE